jgi:hypothetical protein
MWVHVGTIPKGPLNFLRKSREKTMSIKDKGDCGQKRGPEVRGGYGVE